MPPAVLYIGVALLALGAAPWPYGYYTLLRLVATVVFVWAAFVSYQRKDPLLPWVYGLFALLFNPLFKVYLDKELWAAIDLVAALFLFFTRKRVLQAAASPQ